MKDFLPFVGIALLIASVSYYKNAESAQEVENLEKLYQIKEYLGSQKSIQETDLYIENVQKKNRLNGG